MEGLNDKQIAELYKQFNSFDNIKVLKFNSLKLDNQYDFDINTSNGQAKLSQYWKHEKVHQSNRIDLMKYFLAVNSDQIVGAGKPLAVFDFDTLPADGKKLVQ